jgi:hypothetical protein
MKIQKFNIRGTEVNKIQFSEIESYLEEKGLKINQIFATIADKDEFVYVSNGFVMGLKSHENEIGEWHHYFTKDFNGSFDAGKLQFN